MLVFAFVYCFKLSARKKNAVMSSASKDEGGAQPRPAR
jgi:hypothetical protein